MNRWLPLESNPDVINKYLTKLGIPDAWRCCDVYSLDKELLAMIPRPALSLLLLFPITEKYEADATGAKATTCNDVYFIKQNIENACGTIALIHALANNMDKLKLGAGSFKDFYEATKGLDAQARAKALDSNQAFHAAHEDSAKEGQTRAPSRDDKVDLHFVSFVCVNGKLYELDGRKDGPVAHGETTADDFLEHAAVVAKKFMSREPDSCRFTMLALAAKGDE